MTLRPVRVFDARSRREIRAKNVAWLRPWDTSDPETSSSRLREAASPPLRARLGRALPWVVTYGGQFAGELSVWSIAWGSSRSAEVGYWIDESFAGRGIIPTALAMAADHCFRVAGLHRLEAQIRPENAASRRVVEKLGFREEGVRVRRLYVDGAWRDHICYAITAEELPDGVLARWRSQLSTPRSGV